jgi:hypothetical protein
MNWAQPMEFLRNHLKVLIWILYGIMAAAMVFDILIPRHEAHFFGDKIPVFWSAFGFVGCIILIRVMKGLAHTVLMKKEDYYG